MNSVFPSVRLYLLSAPRLERDGALVVVNRRKAVALLAYLALSGRPHLRDTIATLLWPDSGHTIARTNLRHILVVLKQALGDCHLDIEGDTIALKQNTAFWVDVLHFQTLLASGQAHGHAPNDVCADCLPLLLEAVAMHAEQFMAGFSLADSPAFDDWQRSQQQQLLQALSDALDRLVRYFMQTNDYKLAIKVAQRRVGLDTLDEAAHRQLMQLYAWSGQQGLAQRQFEQCAAVLAKELEVSPSAESVRLMQEIQAGRVTAHAIEPHAAGRYLSEPSEPNAEEGWRPAETPRHNLPMRLPSLIGRDHDLQVLQELLQRTDVNLVTLIGTGGVGKTRLSLQLASMLLEQFADGVFFVSLASLREPELVISAIAQTWDLQRQSNSLLVESVHAYLRSKRMLLILDNFEHLMAAAPLISELLANCEYLRIIVTSRELLNVQGEHLYIVPPLSLPEQGGQPSLAAVAKTAAVQLFVRRAQAIAPDFVLDETNAVDIAVICTYLNGLPLAIELVAARIRLLPPRTLRQRLFGATTSSFELLQGGARDAPLRHRTLIDAITWSYDLLTAAEQRLLRLLSVFVGGCTLEMVERVSELAGAAGSISVLDTLASLVNKSLIQQGVHPNGEQRFSLLELIREYGLEQLQANDELAVAARAHAESYAEFVEIAVAALAGPDHLVWTARLNADHDNCRAALQWTITYQHAELAVRIGGTLWSHWLEQGYYYEGRQLLSSVLQLAELAGRVPARARILTGLGAMNWSLGGILEARTCLEEAVAIYQEWGDEHGLATAQEHLAETALVICDMTLASRHFLEAAALYEKVNDRVSMARVRQGLGFVRYWEGDYSAVQTITEETLTIYGEEQHEAGLGDTLRDLGRALFQQQKFAEANQRFAEALQRAKARGDQDLVAHVLYFLGRIAYYQGEYAKADLLFRESLHIFYAIGKHFDRSSKVFCFPLAFLSDLALLRGDVTSAQTMLRESLTLAYREDNIYTVSLILPHFATLAVTLGEHRRAVQLIAAGLLLYHGWRTLLPSNDQLAFETPLAVVRPLLSAEDFAQAWAIGERMTMAEAVALALTTTNDHPSTDRTLQVAVTH